MDSSFLETINKNINNLFMDYTDDTGKNMDDDFSKYIDQARNAKTNLKRKITGDDGKQQPKMSVEMSFDDNQDSVLDSIARATRDIESIDNKVKEDVGLDDVVVIEKKTKSKSALKKLQKRKDSSQHSLDQNLTQMDTVDENITENKNIFSHLAFFKTTRWNPFIPSAFERY